MLLETPGIGGRGRNLGAAAEVAATRDGREPVRNPKSRARREPGGASEAKDAAALLTDEVGWAPAEAACSSSVGGRVLLQIRAFDR